MRYSIYLIFTILLLISGCSIALDQGKKNIFLSEKEINAWQQSQKLPSKFKVELKRDFTPNCDGCQNGDYYWASLYYKFDELYIGTQRYELSDGIGIIKNYDCVYDLTDKKWVTEENRESCDFTQYMIFPLNKEKLQKMIDNSEIVECTNDLESGTLCYEIKLPTPPMELPFTFWLIAGNWMGMESSNIIYNNNKIVHTSDKSLRDFSREKLQTVINKGELVPCDNIDVYIMPYNTNDKHPCYFIETYNPVQLPKDVTIEFSRDSSSSGASRTYNSVLTFSGENLISGTLTSDTWPTSGDRRIKECKLDIKKLIWVNTNNGNSCEISEFNQPPINKNEIQNLINTAQIRLIPECETSNLCFKFNF